jgi:hypothetical protein
MDNLRFTGSPVAVWALRGYSQSLLCILFTHLLMHKMVSKRKYWILAGIKFKRFRSAE